MDLTDAANDLPPGRRHELLQLLAPTEQVLGWFEPDLDQQLHFAPSIVVLTDRRVIDLGPPASAPRPRQSWPLADATTLRANQRAGLGNLQLLGAAGRLAEWHYSTAQVEAADRFAQALKRWRSQGPLEPSGDNLSQATGKTDEESESLADGKGALFSPLVRLLRFARVRRGPIALGLGLTLASTAASLMPPYLTMPLLDRVLIPHQMGEAVDVRLAYWYLGGLAGTALLAWVLGWMRTYVLAWVSERIAADLRNSAYAHLQSLSLEFFGGKRTGDLMSRIGSDTERICNFLSVNLLDFANNVLLIFMTACVLLWIDPWLALVTLAPIPAIAWLIQGVRINLLHGFHQAGIVWGRMTSVLADTIPGIRVVKAFAQEDREIDRFRQVNDQVLKTNDQVNKVWSFFGPTVSLMTELGLLVVWGFGVWQVWHGQVTVGVLTAFLTYISRFYVRLESMSRMLAATQRAAASSQRLFEILDCVPSVAEPAQTVEPKTWRGEIELQNVGFRYGPRAVIDDVSLHIQPGEMVGLVGASGAGKSTLVNLVCRFYDVSEGAIIVDGVDIRNLSLREYRRHIGMVLQEPFLFYGSVAENIAYGKPEATRGEIIEAARMAHAHEFILRLPDGYDSLVGERGQSLSGGERQRISIARALLIDPRILILDEATSSVDTETEQHIQDALDNLIRGRTTIAIAHRLSTLRRADRVVVMDRGKVIEAGPHQELLQASGAYWRLHQAQLELAQGSVSRGEA